VALDGDIVVVGAPEDDRMGLNTGAAYVFSRSGNDWYQQGKLVVSDGAAGNRFGTSVSVSGTSVLVGAPGANAVYVFGRDSYNQWGQQGKISGAGSFGTAVLLRGNTAVIGAPTVDAKGKVYVYTRSIVNGNPVWNESRNFTSTAAGQTAELFGSSLASDGSRLVVGAPGFIGVYNGTPYNQIGAAWVFNYGGWWLEARLTTFDGLPESEAQDNVYSGHHFGASVAVYGNYVVVGAPDYDKVSMDQGAVYVFTYLPAVTRSTGAWNDIS
jgi:hypothetical protein